MLPLTTAKTRLMTMFQQVREYAAARKHAKWEKVNDERLARLTDQHKGEDAVIIGMGPSLQMDDLERFRKMRSFACNKIYLAFDQTTWRPDYYTCIDVLVARNNKEAIAAADFRNCQGIHSMATWSTIPGNDRALRYRYSGSFENWTNGTPAHLSRCLGDGLLSHGYTVVIDQIQLAYAMGFKRVYIVGLDFSFVTGRRSGDSCASGEILIAGTERNHFHKDYRKPGETWTVPRLKQQQHAFAFCRQAFEADGRQLLNASRESLLPTLERISFGNVFN